MPDVTPATMTRSELVAAYAEYSDYDLVQSEARGKLFVQVARILLQRSPKRSASQIRGDEVELDLEVMQRELDKAERWLAANRSRGDASTMPPQFTIDDWR
jgi:hypothetical protein